MLQKMDSLGHRSNAVCTNVTTEPTVREDTASSMLSFYGALKFLFFYFTTKSVKISDTKFHIPILFERRFSHGSYILLLKKFVNTTSKTY